MVTTYYTDGSVRDKNVDLAGYAKVLNNNISLITEKCDEQITNHQSSKTEIEAISLAINDAKNHSDEAVIYTDQKAISETPENYFDAEDLKHITIKYVKSTHKKSTTNTMHQHYALMIHNELNNVPLSKKRSSKKSTINLLTKQANNIGENYEIRIKIDNSKIREVTKANIQVFIRNSNTDALAPIANINVKIAMNKVYSRKKYNRNLLKQVVSFLVENDVTLSNVVIKLVSDVDVNFDKYASLKQLKQQGNLKIKNDKTAATLSNDLSLQTLIYNTLFKTEYRIAFDNKKPFTKKVKVIVRNGKGESYYGTLHFDKALKENPRAMENVGRWNLLVLNQIKEWAKQRGIPATDITIECPAKPDFNLSKKGLVIQGIKGLPSNKKLTNEIGKKLPFADLIYGVNLQKVKSSKFATDLNDINILSQDNDVDESEFRASKILSQRMIEGVPAQIKKNNTLNVTGFLITSDNKKNHFHSLGMYLVNNNDATLAYYINTCNEENGGKQLLKKALSDLNDLLSNYSNSSSTIYVSSTHKNLESSVGKHSVYHSEWKSLINKHHVTFKSTGCNKDVDLKLKELSINDFYNIVSEAKNR